MGTCEACAFYVQSGQPLQPSVCRRFPPVVSMTYTGPVSAFPTVSKHDGCGEHQRIDAVALRVRRMDSERT